MTTDWVQRWHDGNIGFHKTEVHDALLHHWRLRSGTVLVPLCGKSLDLRWLAELGCTVVGVELAERAIRDFFAEQQLTFAERAGDLVAFVCNELPITLYLGDYFRLQIPRCDALYDRAALVALPPDLRARYAAHTNTLLKDNAERVIVTLEYDQQAVNGPPFSVPRDEVRSLYSGIELVGEADCIDEAPPKFRAAGLTSVIECTWRNPAG